MWVKVINGPEWAIGSIAKKVGGFLVFYNQMEEPHWYDIAAFEWQNLPIA